MTGETVTVHREVDPEPTCEVWGCDAPAVPVDIGGRLIVFACDEHLDDVAGGARDRWGA